jgi:hypothetical protein
VSVWACVRVAQIGMQHATGWIAMCAMGCGMVCACGHVYILHRQGHTACMRHDTGALMCAPWHAVWLDSK